MKRGLNRAETISRLLDGQIINQQLFSQQSGVQVSHTMAGVNETQELEDPSAVSRSSTMATDRELCIR